VDFFSHRLKLAAFLFVATAAYAQRLNPITWTAEAEPSSVAPGAKALIRVTATMQSPWHLYSLSTPKGGPIATTIAIADSPVIKGFQIHQPKPERKFDPNFNLDVENYGEKAVFLLVADVAPDAPAGEVEVPVQTRFQACTDKQCLPPRRVTAVAKLNINPAVRAAPPVIPAGYTLFDPTAPPPPATASSTKAPAAQTQAAQEGLATFLAVAFGFGLAAIFTPCVFPMIPITLSFFLNKEGTTRGQSVRQALLFCLGIIVLFTAMGLGIAAAVGPFGVVQLGSNPWVNGFIAVVFAAFGLSLLGAFEITLPSGLLNRMNQASENGGIVGTLLMGLTFSLTSFACVGPFVGTLLAGSVQRGGMEPALGMMSFATGLASPFFLLALFPSYLQRMPRSGGWLVRVKVVLGFIVLAAMLKYVSSVDQVLQWNLLTRERFLAAWFVLFLLPGLYILGWLRMEGINADQPMGVTRLLIGAAFVIFAVSLLPGMFGAPLGELDAYVPLSNRAAGSGGGGESAGGVAWTKNDLDAAMKKAAAENKLVFVSFTGYACTNCHWMKANMFTRPEIASAMTEFAAVELYTDGTDEASEKNQQLQDKMFQTVAIPFYAILDPSGRVIASQAGLNRNAPEFLAFLKTR
jgi:thiol:disulfide interchange protein